MFCASVAYSPDSVDFDFDYFATTHAPKFADMIGENCVRWEVHRALQTPGAPPPPFLAAAYFWVESAEAFGSMLMEQRETIYADIENFSKTQPLRGWAELV
jgi:uncharacterized protein (TIGR02118 family)